MWAQVAVFFAAVCGLVWLALRPMSPEDTAVSTGFRKLSGTIADQFSYREPGEAFPRVSCAACRIGRVKAGVFSIAPFTTVEVDDLVVNIPPSADARPPVATESGRRGVGAGTADAAKAAVGGLDAPGIRKLVWMASGQQIGRIGGIKINGLSIGRMVGRDLAPVLSARKLENSGRKILLHGVVLHADGVVQSIGRAELATKPSLAVVWPGGRFVLPDF